MKYLRYLLLTMPFTSCQPMISENRTHDQEYIFDTYWKEIDRNYSFFEYNNVDWDSVYSSVKPLIDPTLTDDSLFAILAKTTTILNDAHTNLYSPKGIGGNIDYFDKYPANQISLDPDMYFDYYNPGKVFEYGKLKNANIGYIKIKTFEGASTEFEKIDSIFGTLTGTDKIILDVRSNFGGKVSNSQIIANRLADTIRFVGQYRIRNGVKHNDFSSWINLYISPADRKIPIKKPIIILTNRRSYSATEWFVLFAEVLPNVRVMGDTTGGGSAIPIFRELPNGWLLRISNTQIRTSSGKDFQNIGLFPDVPVWIDPDDEQKGIDTILKRAML